MLSNIGGEEQNWKEILEMQMLKGQGIIVKYAKTIQENIVFKTTFVELTEQCFKGEKSAALN